MSEPTYTTEQLKACPFCGKQPRSQWNGCTTPDGDCGFWGIDCCLAHSHADTEEDAAAKWNTRALTIAEEPNTELKRLAQRFSEECDGLRKLRNEEKARYEQQIIEIQANATDNFAASEARLHKAEEQLSLRPTCNGYYALEASLQSEIDLRLAAEEREKELRRTSDIDRVGREKAEAQLTAIRDAPLPEMPDKFMTLDALPHMSMPMPAYLADPVEVIVATLTRRIAARGTEKKTSPVNG